MKEIKELERNRGLLIGIRPVIEAIDSGKQIDKILLQKGLKKGDVFQKLNTLIKRDKILTVHVPLAKLNRITRKNHQGVIAFSAAIEFQNLGETITRVFEAGKNPLILI